MDILRPPIDTVIAMLEKVERDLTYLLDSTQHESLEMNMPQVIAVRLLAHPPSQSMDVWEKCALNPGDWSHQNKYDN